MMAHKKMIMGIINGEGGMKKEVTTTLRQEMCSPCPKFLRNVSEMPYLHGQRYPPEQT
jgi:hypothetical protein